MKHPLSTSAFYSTNLYKIKKSVSVFCDSCLQKIIFFKFTFKASIMSTIFQEMTISFFTAIPFQAD